MRTEKTLVAVILEVYAGDDADHVSNIHIPDGLDQNVLAETALSMVNRLDATYQHWALEAISEVASNETTTPQFGSGRTQLSVVPSTPPDDHGDNEMFEVVFGDE